jgi:short-subunit dehydrogenase
VQQKGVQVDFLVNNAGVGVFGDFIRETELADELAMIRVNIIAPLHLTKLSAGKRWSAGRARSWSPPRSRPRRRRPT